jgi:hypothetical protein
MCEGSASPRTYASVNKYNSCYYCGKLGHYVMDCRKMKFHNSKYRRPANNFVDREEIVSDNVKNIKLFISYG